MKSTCWSLLIAVCAGAGCLTPSSKPAEKPTAPPPRVSKAARTIPPVTEDRVHEDNVPEVIHALGAELDRDTDGK
jgi:hypothetical protein